MSIDKLVITDLKKKNRLSEIRIDNKGNIFLNGELYDENNPKHSSLNVSSQKYRRIETGDETQKMINEGKNAKKGDLVVITDINTENKSQKTTVKF